MILCSFFSSTGLLNRVKMEGTAAGHMSNTQACALAARTQAQIHTHAAMYELQWEEVSGKGEKKMGQGTVPSPSAVTCYTLPFSPRRTASVCAPLPPSQKWVCASRGCAISHPLHSLTWSGGVCVEGGGSQQLYIVMLGTILSVTVRMAHSNEMKNERTCFHRRIHYFVGERNKRHLL